jgi:hypothetical protein
MITGRAGKKAGVADADRVRLEIALELANAPPVNYWPPAHLKNFRAMLKDFFGISGRLRPMTPPEKYSREAIAELKAWTESQLEGFMMLGRVIIGLDAADVPLILEVVRDKRGDARTGAMRGPVSAVWALGVAFLLASEPASRLRRCPDQKCGRYFLRRGKMEHCSVRCARRVYMREWRTR